MIYLSKLTKRMALARAAFALAALLNACALPDATTSPAEPTPVEVSEVLVLPESLAVVVGNTIKLSADIRDRNGRALTGEAITWTSSDASIATVDTGGSVLLVRTGDVQIRAFVRGRQGHSKVTSLQVPVTTVIVSPTPMSVSVGQQSTLSALTLSSTGASLTGRAVTWASSNVSVARVDSSGRVTGVAVGGVMITATSESIIGSSSVSVLQAPVASVTVNPASASALVGANSAFTAAMRDAAGNLLSGRAVTWTTTNPGVATVSSTGVAAAVAAGSATIRATSEGIVGSATLTVTAPAPVLQGVVLTPASVSLLTGATQQFNVSGQWSNGATTAPSVTYSATGGTISSGGLYTAGSTAGTFRVIAVQQGGTLADTSSITITAPAPVLQGVVLTPASVSLLTGATQQFNVSGQWSNGATTAPSVTYSATGGTISSGGLYTAGSSAGTFRVIAVQQGGTLADTSSITITAPAPVLQGVVLTPASVSLLTGATQQFNVSGQWSNGATTAPSVTYSATGGTISSGGLYTAGSSAGTFRVIAVQQGGTLADTSSITVTAPAPVLQGVVLTPASVSLLTGATQQFNVSGQWSNGATTAPSVTYSATGGTISSGGLYTAGSSAGTFRVIAVQQGGTLADTSSITVTAPAPVLQGVVLTPASVSLLTGATQQFNVSGQWSNGATTAPSVTYSATGGTISSGGLYTAGSSAGTFRVIAVQQGGTLADTAVVTLQTPPPPGANSMYYNSAEPICAPTNASILFCDDFEDGDWYIKDADQARSSGGFLQTDGWEGTIYANPLTPVGAALCAARGAKGTSCAATSGLLPGIEGKNMAMHTFAGGPVTELWARWYYRTDAGYQWGAEKNANFTKNAGDIAWFNIQFNCGSGSRSATATPYIQIIHGSDLCQGPNVSSITLQSARWYAFEVHVRLNSSGTVADGLVEMWIDDCGLTGACAGTPTLRTRMQNVIFDRNQTNCSTSPCKIEVLWLENWGNPGSTGWAYYDQFVVSKSGPIGFMP